MSRSVSKGPFVDHFFFHKLTTKGNISTKKIKVWSRRSCILPQFVGKHFEIYNGKSFVSLEVHEDMIGHKFGEFAMTRKKALHKKKEKKKK